ncbi:MAG TPA: YlxR family protein [Armatimonadota bacterium]
MPRAQPVRTCAGCRRRRAKQELLRIARNPAGEVYVDATGRDEGRGVYVCHDAACLETAVRRKALDRGLKAPVPTESVEAARTAIANRPPDAI